MVKILLVIQIFIVVGIALLVLLQKTGGDSLAGLSGGGGNFMSSRASTNALYKITIILAVAFFLNSIIIAKVYSKNYNDKKSVIQDLKALESLPLENVAPAEPEAPTVVE